MNPFVLFLLTIAFGFGIFLCFCKIGSMMKSKENGFSVAILGAILMIGFVGSMPMFLDLVDSCNHVCSEQSYEWNFDKEMVDGTEYCECFIPHGDTIESVYLIDKEARNE